MPRAMGFSRGSSSFTTTSQTTSQPLATGPKENSNGCEVVCEVVVKLEEPLEKPIALGIESIVNLLAPAEPDRFFETSAGHENLRFSGTLPPPVLRMEDGWQRVRVVLHALSAKEIGRA